MKEPAGVLDDTVQRVTQATSLRDSLLRHDLEHDGEEDGDDDDADDDRDHDHEKVAHLPVLAHMSKVRSRSLVRILKGAR